MHTYSILVSGKVQGVFYRQSTREQAGKLGLTGYVENLPGGDVAIVATGTKEQIDLLIEWCRRGPARAKVESIEVKEISLTHFDDFSIRKSR